MVLDGVVLVDTSARVHLPARQRQVGLVVQDYCSSPTFPPWRTSPSGCGRGAPRAVRRAPPRPGLERMGLAGLEERRPHELSGGQAQRSRWPARSRSTPPCSCSTNRSPRSMPDRPAVRADLRRHLRSYRGCTVLVTHDPLEAMVLGDRIVVLEQGRVVQDGSPAELARHPRTDYVARLVGLNLLRGDARGRIVTLGPQAAVVVAHDASGPVHVAFAPAAVTLSLDQPHGSARNAWSGRVRDVERHGDLVRITVDGPVPLLADVTPLAVADLALGPGVEVWAAVKATEVSVYPA